MADPPAIVRHVCDVLQLSYRREMLDRSARPSWWGISWDPALSGRTDIFGSAVGRHLSGLSPVDSCFIQLRAGREMARWGYRAGPVPLTATDRGRVAVLFALEAAWRAVRPFWSGRKRHGLGLAC